MPKERIYSAVEEGERYDACVQWGKAGASNNTDDGYGGYVWLTTVDQCEDKPQLPGVMLDRHGLNRLIRALRRARDQAYGADA